MSDQELLNLLGALVAQESRIAAAAEAIASVIAPAPNIVRPMGDWGKAADILESLGATVTDRDASGPTRAEYQGRIYVRRSAKGDEDGDGAGDAIWFNCVLSGNVKDGNVKWARLLTFRDRKTDKLPGGAKKLKVATPAKPEAAQAGRGPTTSPAPVASTAKATEASELDKAFGPNPRQAAPKQQPALDPAAARTKFYATSSTAIKSGKITHQEVNDLVKAANGDGFVAALRMLEEKLA